MNTKRILSQRVDVAWKEIDEMAILMDLGPNKKIHRLNNVGTFIWKQFDGKNSIDDIHRSLCDEFDVARELAQKELLELITKLEDLGVIIGK